MAALEPYSFEPNKFKLWNNSIEDSEVGNRLEKIDSADLVKDAKSVAGFSPSHHFRVERIEVT